MVSRPRVETADQVVKREQSVLGSSLNVGPRYQASGRSCDPVWMSRVDGYPWPCGRRRLPDGGLIDPASLSERSTPQLPLLWHRGGIAKRVQPPVSVHISDSFIHQIGDGRSMRAHDASPSNYRAFLGSATGTSRANHAPDYQKGGIVLHARVHEREIRENLVRDWGRR